MRRSKISAVALFCWSFLAWSSPAAVVLVDDFSFNSFALQSGGTTLNDTKLSSVFALRTASGSGTGNWFAAVNSSQGVFDYSVSLSGLPTQSQFFRLQYLTRGNTVDLLGLNALVLNVTALTGEGALQVYLGPTGPAPLVPISGLGDVVFSFPELFPNGWGQFLNDIRIIIRPKTADFSIRLSEISLIPEPGAGLLLVTAGCAWMARRRQPKARP